MNTRFVTALILSAAALSAQQIAGPYSGAINISGDMTSAADSRATTWGTSTSYVSTIVFAQVPAGYRVRILRVYGDFIALPKGSIASGQSAEVGWGLKTTAPDGSKRITYPGYQASGYDNSFVWRQDLLTPANQGVSLHFDYDVSAGGLLGSDNTLLSQMFVALNTSGLTIHEEPTFVVVYQYEPGGSL